MSTKINIYSKENGGIKMAIKFVLNETSYFGANARENLVEEIKKRGFKKVLLVTDKALVEAGVTAKVEEILRNGEISN